MSLRRSRARPIGALAFGVAALAIAVQVGDRRANSVPTALQTRREAPTVHDLEDVLPDGNVVVRESRRQKGTPLPSQPTPTATGASAAARGLDVPPRKNSTQEDDLVYLNPGRDAVSGRLEPAKALAASFPPMRDDFVTLPEVEVASNGSPEEARRLVREAMDRYRQEANVVDARLVRNVSLAVKHASMDEVCEELARQTGVQIVAGRNVRDENVTIFTKPRPAREVMREIGRVFGFGWERLGEEGHYSYRLKQDTASQIAEERQRNADVAQAIQSLTRRVRAGREGKESKADLCREAFSDLLGGELERLQAGGTLEMDLKAKSGGNQLDGRVSAALLATMGGVIHNADGTISPGVSGDTRTLPFSKMADAYLGLTFRMRVTEFGGARLDASVSSGSVEGGLGLIDDVSLGEAKGVAEASPDNARANASLRAEAYMLEPVVLTPKPTTTLEEQGEDPGPLSSNDVASMYAGYRTVEGLKPPRPFMTSDDVWQAVHEATGRDVFADSFSRLFKLTNYRGTLFNALSQACDAMHMRWNDDEGWLVGRSCAWLWQRENEVPKAELARWAKTQHTQGALPLDAVLEMSLLSDRQLDAIEVGKTIANQWGLLGWGIPSRPLWGHTDEPVRPLCRFLAELPPNQLDAVREHALPAGQVSAENLAQIHLRVGLNVGPETLLGVDYVPAGKYFWSPFFEEGKETVHDDLIIGDTEEAVETEVHKRYPERPRGEVKFSDGKLTLTIQKTNMKLTQGDERFGVGHRVP